MFSLSSNTLNVLILRNRRAVIQLHVIPNDHVQVFQVGHIHVQVSLVA